MLKDHFPTGHHSQEKTLAQRVEEAHAFFDPQNLADLIIKYDGDIGFLAIDVQKQFCDPAAPTGWGSEETDRVSESIKSLAPEFRKAGVPVYAVYFDSPKKSAADVDFYKFIPEPEDTLVAKNQRSAFKGGNIKKVLEKDHRKLLLACGVYLDRCVKDTVIDAVKQGFDVCLLRDLTGDYAGDASHTDKSLERMTEKGVAVLQSEQVLKALRISKNAAGAPGM